MSGSGLGKKYERSFGFLFIAAAVGAHSYHRFSLATIYRIFFVYVCILAITHRFFNAVTFPCGPCDSAYFTLYMVLFSPWVLEFFTGGPLPWVSSLNLINQSNQSI